MKKKLINAYIERSITGEYSVYYNDSLPVSVHGEGATAHQAIADFLTSVSDFTLELNDEKKKIMQGVEFRFVYDVASLLSYYSKYISLVGLSELTGINRVQLSHYISGHRKPSAQTTQKIQDAFRKLGADLAQVNLA